jgi:hypothetical protein
MCRKEKQEALIPISENQRKPIKKLADQKMQGGRGLSPRERQGEQKIEGRFQEKKKQREDH